MKDYTEYVDEKIEFISRRKRRYFKMESFHFHNKHELYYLESGSTKYFIGSEIYELSPGDFIFVPKGAYHRTNSEESAVCERLLLVFDNDFVGKSYLKYIKDMTSNKHIRIPEKHLEELRMLLGKMEKENSLRQKNYEEMQKLYFRQLLVLISRYREMTETVLSENDRLIQRAAQYINSHYSDNLSLDVLARRYSVSPGHFSKLFKRTTGVGLSEYINIIRITAACEMLEESGLPIMEVASRCGYNDSNYFTQVFKKIKGVTPKRYAMQEKA